MPHRGGGVLAVVGLPNNSQPQGHKDIRAGLNLISPAVISKLQIVEEQLEVTGMFQGVNPGRSHPKGKITLPMTFGGGIELSDQEDYV